MAQRRRRMFRRTFAGKRGGRQYFWFRFTPFGMTLQEAASATHASEIVDEASWQDPSAGLNETKRGGPRLERLIVDFGLSVEANDAFWQAAGSANIALIPEFMIWSQTDQFGPAATSSANWDITRNNQRVIMNEVPFEKTWYRTGSTQSVRTVNGRYESKSKVRLSEKAIVAGWRGLFNTADAQILGYTDWMRPTMLISLP